MISLLAMLVVLLPALAGFGKIFQKCFGIFFSGIAATLLSGIFFVSILLTVFAFFIPLNIENEIFILGFGLFSFFIFKGHHDFWNFFIKVSKRFYVIALVIVVAGTFYPFILDHFGYYVPTIKWISEYGLIKGISNLDLLLGQMSVWHIFQAGFSHFADPFLRINILVLIIYLIYIFEKKSWIHLFFLPIFFLFAQSPSPDLPVFVFCLIILNEIFNGNKNGALLFAFAAFVFAIKPTMIWLPLFVFFYGFFILNSPIKFLFFGISVLAVFIFKNIWTFGFPVFPVQIIDLDFPWKPNAELLKNSSQMSILKTFDLQYSYSEIQHFSFFEKAKNWFFLHGIKGKINLAFLLSLVAFAVFTMKTNSKILWFLFFSVLIKSVLVLLFSAQYRFFLEVFFVIFFVIFHKKASKYAGFISFGILSFLILVIMSFPKTVQTLLPSFRPGNFMSGFTFSQLFEPAHYGISKYKTHRIGNLKFNVVENYPFSFETPLPAISPQFLKEYLDAGIFPQLQGKNLQEGFIWKKLSQKEKIDLKKIVAEFDRNYKQ